MSAEFFMWLGRSSSLVVFVLGGFEVALPLQRLPPPLLNILQAIFLFVVAMIIVAMVEIVGTLLRNLDVLGSAPDPTKVDQVATSIFRTFGMAIRQIGNIGKTTIKPEHTPEGKHD